MKRGNFIVLEGLDRSGKSTMVRHIQQTLQNKFKQTTCIYNFPDRSTKIGSMINEFLISKVELPNEAIHLLFSANRWENMNRIKEELSSGNNIVCDRYWYSGVAYSMAKGLDYEWCKKSDQGLIEPDLVIYLSANPEILTERAGYGQERFQKIDFQKKVKHSFDQIFSCIPNQNKKQIDVTGMNLEEVKSEIEHILTSQLKLE